MKTAYSYQRWSTKSQSQSDRDSKIRQTNSANQWMKDFGLSLGFTLSDEVFRDAGVSGFKGSHVTLDEYGRAKSDLMRFIQSVESGKIKRDSILFIDDYSRFSRLQPFKSLKLFTDVIDSGIGLVFTGSYEKRIINSDLINREGNVLQFIIGELIRSYQESAEKGRKIREAKQTLFSNIKSGIIQRNNLPKYVTFVPNEGSKSIGKYNHNDKTPLVKELVRMFLEGKSLYSIADSLNERKIKTFKGREWSGNGISHILRNRLLIGEYKSVKGYIKPIIEESDFNKVQAILNNNNFNHGQRGELLNIFRGICFCSDCGLTMSVMSSYNPKDKETKYRYLRCSSVGRGKHIVCKNRSCFRLKEMEEDFFLSFMFKSPTQLINGDDNKELKQLKESITLNQIKLQKVTSKIATLIKLSDGESNVDELKPALAGLNKERDTIKGEIDRLNLMVSSVQDSPEKFSDLRELFLKAQKVRRHEDINIEDFKKSFKAIEDTIDCLSDNNSREGIRIMLPSLIGKITVDTNEGRFFVFNRMEKMIFKSDKYISNRNCSVEWIDSLRNYQTRKVNGRVIKLNRREYKSIL
jgi:DNA invertase Pin-like site-specific DNA recombinase